MRIALQFAALFGSASAALQAAPIDLLLGHYEVHIDYVPVPGDADAGWTFSVSFDEDNDFNDGVGITRLDPASVRLVAAPTTLSAISSAIESAAPEFGEIDDPFWLLPQNNNPDNLFLGLRTVIAPGVFQSSVNGFFSASTLGNIILEVTAVAGSAPDEQANFAMWESKAFGNLEFHFDSSDGIGAEDRLEPVAVGSHTHYNWGMTRPGEYRVTFRASGKLNPWQANPNQLTSGETTVAFMVPFSGQVAGAADLHLSTAPGMPAVVRSPQEGCEYALNRVALVTEATSNGGTAVPFGFRLSAVGDAAASVHRVGIEGSDPVQLPAGYTFQTPALEILDAEGPGSATAIAASPGEVLVSFDEAGIYRVTLRARLLDDSSDPQNGDPFTLVFLAGLPVDYDYAAYADSFERQHGLAAGALADPFLDGDDDGVPNGVEFQLFWHGFDPAERDGGKLPLPTYANGGWGVSFLRDTYKDDFGLAATSLAAAYSADLAVWDSWHTQGASKPDADDEIPVFENGTGAATLGRIMERRLEVDGSGKVGFFRFEVF